MVALMRFGPESATICERNPSCELNRADDHELAAKTGNVGDFAEARILIAQHRVPLVSAPAVALFALMLFFCIGGKASETAVVDAVPVVTGSLVGSAQVVFDTAQNCEITDIPDAPARAFRDDHGVVHLIATHSIARASLGSSLDSVKHDCRVIYRSPKDTDPAHFQYKNWLASFFTDDGRHIAALVHSEFDAFEIPGQCATPEERNNCWWNTVTFANSKDGGYSFSTPSPPQNLVAAMPYRYVVGNRKSAYGYYGPTNMLKVGEFYYAMINDWPYAEQAYGPCLLRTKYVSYPNSWRAWDGKSFSVIFADPYHSTVTSPKRHTCLPVFPGEASSLVKLDKYGIFVVTQFTPDERFGPPGLYVASSKDLIHWSRPLLAASTQDMQNTEPLGSWNYGYFSLLDPESTDRNFSTSSTNPYAYYIRLDHNHMPYARVLFRRRIKLIVVR